VLVWILTFILLWTWKVKARMLSILFGKC